MIAEEIKVCTRVATVYSRNYYAWTYRNFIVTLMSADGLREEREAMERWVRTHVSDYSGFHHRMVVVSLLGIEVGCVSLETIHGRDDTVRAPSSISSSSRHRRCDRIEMRRILTEELTLIRDLTAW